MKKWKTKKNERSLETEKKTEKETKCICLFAKFMYNTEIIQCIHNCKD